MALEIERKFLVDAQSLLPLLDSETDHLERTGALQLDSVNVLDRAHYLTLWSRFGPYDRRALERIAESAAEGPAVAAEPGDVGPTLLGGDLGAGGGGERTHERVTGLHRAGGVDAAVVIGEAGGKAPLLVGLSPAAVERGLDARELLGGKARVGAHALVALQLGLDGLVPLGEQIPRLCGNRD